MKILFFLLFLNINIYCQTVPYVSVSTNINGIEYWSTSNHWAKYPTKDMELVIFAGELIIDTNVECRQLILNPGAKLILADGYTLTINGDFTIQCYNGERGEFVNNTINGLILKGNLIHQCDEIITSNNNNTVYQNSDKNYYNLLGQLIKDINSYEGIYYINNKLIILWKRK